MTFFFKAVILFALLLTAVNPSTLAGEHDAIYLKDSTIIRGYIIQDVPDDYLKLLTIDDTLALIPYEVIYQKNKEDDSKIGTDKWGQYYKWEHKGVIGRTGFIFPDGDDKAFEISLTYPLFISKKGAIGIGFCWSNYSFTDVFSIYGDIRYTFNNVNLAPFLFADAGYTTEIYSNGPKIRDIGILGNIGVGFEVFRTKAIYCGFEASYKVQKCSLFIRRLNKYPGEISQKYLGSAGIFLNFTVGASIFGRKNK